ncbi:MAG: nitroreductase [Spongiibacteraceae bacterium]
MNHSTIFSDIVNQRRSVRAFLPKTVEQDILQSVFEVAQRAPSNCNTQPWQVSVASGETIAGLKESLPEAFNSGAWSMDFPYEGKYEGEYKDRQYGAANALYQSANIERSDKVARHQQFMQNFRFFDAPHVAFLFLPEPFGLREAADLGMYAQNLMLSMSAHGLASCPQTALSFCADLVRESLGVAENNKLLFGLSFGYEDSSEPINHCITDRAALSDVVSFHN